MEGTSLKKKKKRHGRKNIFGLLFPMARWMVVKDGRPLWACLVIEFKNFCLKRCGNCSLKSVVKIHVFSVYRTKKCVWYHVLNNMFQCSKI